MKKKSTHKAPTVSSQNKSLNVASFRDRLAELNNTVKELKTEASQYENLEKNASKHYSFLELQIKTLKKAFDMLADCVIEELDIIKTNVSQELEININEIYTKLDILDTNLASNKGGDTSQINASIKMLMDRVEKLEKKYEDHFHNMSLSIDRNKEDNKLIFDKLKTVVNGNVKQLEILTQDNVKTSSFKQDMQKLIVEHETEFKSLRSLIENFGKKVDKLSDTNHNNVKSSKKQDDEITEMLLRESKSLMNSHNELEKRLSAIESTKQIPVQSSNSTEHKKIQELERTIYDLHQDFQETIQNLLLTQKENSSQIIMDFEKAITSISNETKILYKRFGLLEGVVKKQKDDLENRLSFLEIKNRS